MKKYILLVFMVILLAGCAQAPDPRSVADADATRSKSEQQALDAIQARAKAQAKFDLQQKEQEQEAAQRVQFWNTFSQWLSYGAVFVIMGLALGVGKGGFEAFVGLGKATAKAAENKAERVYMDPETMTFPLIPVYLGERRIAMFNGNDNSIIMFDLSQPGDRQKIAGLFAQNLSIGVANKAMQHKTDPTGVAMVGTNPLMVGVREEKADGGVFEVGEFMQRTIDAEASDE